MDALLSLVGITTAISRRQREIEIGLQPDRLSKWALLEVIESALAEALPLGRRTKTNFKLRPALVRTNLVLAPIADYLFPPLGWASAAVISTLGVTHLGPAVAKKGDVAPSDGTILRGEATLHEGILTGSSSPAKKAEGSEIYATTEVIEGDIQVRIGTGQTLANRLTELYSAAFSQPDNDSHALRLAEMLVTPIILAGVAALGRGGVHMTKSVMRPDFLCGPSVVEEFGDLWVVLRAAERGIVVLDTGVLDPIFKANYWLFDDTVPWHLAEATEDTLRSLKNGTGREIVYLSDGGSKLAVEREGRYIFSRLDVGGSSAAKRPFVARRQSQGQSVAYFGDCEKERALANLADVAVTVTNGNHRLIAGTPIAFLSPDLEKFGVLHALCQRRNTEVTNGFISTALPNVAAMVAAIYFHAPALFSVAMTTLGTIFCYSRASSLLKESTPESDIIPEPTN